MIDILNGFHPSVKFTHVVEEDDSTSFLDVLVKRSRVKKEDDSDLNDEDDSDSNDDDNSDSQEEQTPTFTGLMTHWNSFVPFSYKKAGVVSMIKRAISVRSAYSLLKILMNKCSLMN